MPILGSQPKNTIRIRPFALVDPESRDGSGDPHLSIEINGRILPLTKFVEIVGGEIVAEPAARYGASRD